MTVHFENVGHSRLSWDAEMEILSERALLRAIRRRKALASRCVEFTMEIEGENTVGAIYVGNRSVGSFRIDGALMLKIPTMLLGGSTK